MRGQNIVNRGNDHLMQALELLSDPDRLKKALDEIKAEQKTLEDRIALAGTAREIVEKETRIDHELTEAREATTTAREEAEATRVKAEAEAEEIVATATSEAADLNESAQATLKDAQGRRDAAQEKFAETQRTEQALVQREQTIGKMEAKLERQLADVDELQTQLLQEKSRLATVSETLKAAVG